MASEAQDVPHGWQTTNIGSLATVRRGASPRPIQDPRWFSHSGPGWIRIADVTRSHRVLRRTEQYLSSEGVSKTVLLQPGALIMSICATIGKPIILGMQACIHDGFVFFDNLRPGICREFLYYFLQWREPALASLGQHGTQKNLNTGIVSAIDIALPPLPEQRKIAAILSSVDDTIEKTEAVIDQLEVVKKGLLGELLTRGIPGRHKEFRASPIGRIPNDWGLRAAFELCERVVVGIVVQPAKYYTATGVPCLRSQNVREDRLDLTNLVFISENSNSLLSKSILRAGDVVTVRTGYPGTSAEVPRHLDGVNCIDLIVSTPRKGVLRGAFLSRVINSQIGMRQVAINQGGLAQQHFNVGGMKRMLVPVPPLHEQDEIIERIVSIDLALQCNRAVLATLRESKRGLLDSLLVGRIRVDASAQEAA